MHERAEGFMDIFWRAFIFHLAFPLLSKTLDQSYLYSCPLLQWKTKERKMGLYREMERGETFLFLCPMTHPHYWALCRRNDRNGVLWPKEWPIHPSHNFRFHKCAEILLYFSFVLGGVLLWPACSMLCFIYFSYFRTPLVFLISCWSAEENWIAIEITFNLHWSANPVYQISY